MKEFVSVFKNELTDYLAAREKTVEAVTFHNDLTILGAFDRYLHEAGITERRVTEAAINGWIQLLYETKTKNKVADMLGYVRNFLKYLQYCGVPVFIPKNPKLTDDYIPYIFSDEELGRIFHAADIRAAYCENGKLNLTHAEMPMILRMLYGCGFRISELLNVRVGDVNFKKQTVFLKDTKNKKQRIVPISGSLSQMLERYCLAMGIKDKPQSYLFPGRKHDEPVSKGTVASHFRALLKCDGIYVEPEPHKRGQCVHCLRHLFAIRAFTQAEHSGRSPANSVPYLSVYLGHYDMDGTERYLKFSGDMFPEYSDLFETYAEAVFSGVAYEE